MAELIPPEKTLFGVLADGCPVAVLAVGPDGAAAVPVTVGSEPGDLPEWRLMARPEMTVVDGPGDAGFLVPVDPRDLPASAAWAQRVVERDGALVMFVNDPAELEAGVDGLLEAEVPGGFIRSV